MNKQKGQSLLKKLITPAFILSTVLVCLGSIRIIYPSLYEYPAIIGTTKVLLVGMIAWVSIRIINAIAEKIHRYYDISSSNNLKARSVHTQIDVLRRIAVFTVFIIAISALFLLFDQLRAIGVSLIASAGVAGIIIGFAAQKAIGNLLAGIQIALTQPIRIDDAVVVEGEWGWIEEITLTYIVIRIWDLRRLVVPISYFIEKPFQNWTRKSADIIGSVLLYTDYTMPIEPIREKLDILLEGKEDLWDGKVKVVQVTESKPETMEIRILVSAHNSPKAWDLRCYIREEMISFLQTSYFHCLPKVRAEIRS